MKNQFFADKHDYFKYDLWLEVAEKLKEKGIGCLTLIPMATPDDSTKEGSKISYTEGEDGQAGFSERDMAAFGLARHKAGSFKHTDGLAPGNPI